MRTLGESRQVLAVTHLPQVAARAHHHYQVSKRSRGGAISSAVTLLDDEQRVDEVARMLGGARLTETTRQHATELLAMGRGDSRGKAGKNKGAKVSKTAAGRKKSSPAKKPKTTRAARAT
jgi:DNA repair protein RecN (Recombination protein N)